MKKKLDLFGLKAYDEKIDNEDKELTLQDQFYSQSVKHIKDKRKSSKRIDVGFICFCIGWLFIMAVFLIYLFIVPTDIEANAAEEVESAQYINYTIELSSAPIHFIYPYTYSIQPNSTPRNYFNDFIVVKDSSNSLESETYVDMLYQVLGSDGTIYSESIVRVGYTVDSYIPNNSVNAQNSFNGIALTMNQLPTYTTFAQLTTYSTTDSQMYRRYRPSLSYDVETAPFTINVSSLSNVNVTGFKIRACSFHDYKSYGNIPAIWYDYTFTNESVSTSSTALNLHWWTTTSSTTPLYPIERDDNVIFNDGYNQGYNKGYREGYEVAQPGIYDDAYNTGYDNGYRIGKSNGYNQGVEEANEYSFLSLTTAVVDAPVKIFSSMFDFNVLGFNMTTFLFSIITLCLVLAVVKRLL